MSTFPSPLMGEGEGGVNGEHSQQINVDGVLALRK
jgi:hypothetical protein